MIARVLAGTVPLFMTALGTFPNLRRASMTYRRSKADRQPAPPDVVRRTDMMPGIWIEEGA
jgi:hypothetical protein